MSLYTDCGEPPYYYSDYKPILMHRDVLGKSIAFSSSRDLKEPGKIYVKGNILYINEKYTGFHVIDNTDPQNPINTGFITVPGSIDIAIKKDILYVDNSVDLVAIDISNGVQNLSVSKRVKSVFPELLPPDGRTLDTEYKQENRPANTVIVGWVKIGK